MTTDDAPEDEPPGDDAQVPALDFGASKILAGLGSSPALDFGASKILGLGSSPALDFGIDKILAGLERPTPTTNSRDTTGSQLRSAVEAEFAASQLLDGARDLARRLRAMTPGQAAAACTALLVLYAVETAAIYQIRPDLVRAVNDVVATPLGLLGAVLGILAFMTRDSR